MLLRCRSSPVCVPISCALPFLFLETLGQALCFILDLYSTCDPGALLTPLAAIIM